MTLIAARRRNQASHGSSDLLQEFGMSESHRPTVSPPPADPLQELLSQANQAYERVNHGHQVETACLVLAHSLEHLPGSDRERIEAFQKVLTIAQQVAQLALEGCPAPAQCTANYPPQPQACTA